MPKLQNQLHTMTI